MHTWPGFSVGAGDMNSDHKACVVSITSTEPLPQPFVQISKFSITSFFPPINVFIKFLEITIAKVWGVGVFKKCQHVTPTDSLRR